MFQCDARLSRDNRVEIRVNSRQPLTEMSHEQNFQEIDGSICAPRGFKARRFFATLRRLGTGKGSEKGRKHDLALIVSDAPAAVAGMFTTNQVCAAPVKLSAQRAAQAFCAGNCGEFRQCKCLHGPAGNEGCETNDSKWRQAALKLKASDVLVCSTGRIGVPMPMKNVERGIRACAPLLARSATNARQAAEAIMTTDTRRKEIAVEFKIGRSTVRIGGICKGAGMIQPRNDGRARDDARLHHDGRCD